MVVSKINNTVNYSEQKTLYPEDVEHNATTYETEILEFDVLIAIGKEKFNFVEKNIIFFPVYLIKNDKVYSQIGLYEIKSDKLVNVLDDDGDLNMDLVGNPLLYSFASKEYLSGILKEDVVVDDNMIYNESDDPDDPDDPDKLIQSKQPTLKINTETIKSLTNENEEDSTGTTTFVDDNSVHTEAITKVDDPEETIPDKALWIQKYMKSKHFGIQDNEGGGDCLFAVIRDAFNSIGKKTTINKLRDILSREANDEIFTMYKQHYDMYESSVKENNTSINELTQKNKKLKKELGASKSRTRQIEIVEEGKDILLQYNKLKEENKITQELKNEFSFMHGVDNLEDFKSKLKTCEFWGETWAISTLERALNIKLILLSHESYVQGDIDNVITCGQLNDAILEKKGIFKPDYYILTDFNGWHYKLITYKGRKILKQNEIPLRLKNGIIEKCCENENGPYSIIEGFKTEKKELNKNTSKADVVEPIHQTKYDDAIVFQIYGNSSNKPYPGKGSGEKISKEYLPLFGDLKTIPEWRRMLSDEWVQKFVFDKHEWSSVKHCVEGIKYKNDKNMEMYEKFSLSSGSELSREISLIDKERKDKEYISSEVYESILTSKFSQNEDLKNVLLKTHKALLMNYVKGKPALKNNELMSVRSKLTE
jgi:hypothetical protein